VIIIFALASLPALSFLRRRELVYLGQISYSIYLYHVTVLLVLLYSFYGKIPLPVILITSLILGFPIAAFGHHFVELPSVALGHKLSNLFQFRPKVPPAAPPPAVPEKELVGTR
jgi:peptidoglycan/LPS O-acetylase OafA/YrhL